MNMNAEQDYIKKIEAALVEFLKKTRQLREDHEKKIRTILLRIKERKRQELNKKLDI